MSEQKDGTGYIEGSKFSSLGTPGSADPATPREMLEAILTVCERTRNAVPTAYAYAPRVYQSGITAVEAFVMKMVRALDSRPSRPAEAAPRGMGALICDKCHKVYDPFAGQCPRCEPPPEAKPAERSEAEQAFTPPEDISFLHPEVTCFDPPAPAEPQGARDLLALADNAIAWADKCMLYGPSDAAREAMRKYQEARAEAQEGRNT
jgi:hypothetical protein